MTAAADLVVRNGEIHTLAPEGDETADAVAVRDGRIVAVDSDYEIDHRTGVETEVIDCEGRVVLPGFVDAHTHLPMVGRYAINADLSTAGDPGDAVSTLRAHAEESDREWLLGFGYDESTWTESRYLTRDDLDAVSDDRPVVAFREDMHLASCNSVALGRAREAMPDADVRTEGGRATGVVVEEALDVIWETVEPDRQRMTEIIHAAQERAVELGVTGVHDMVRQSEAPAVYRELDRVGELALRVRLNYWADHLDAVHELGLRTNHGSGMVRTGAIKTYTDGSIGSRTAMLSTPYDDWPGAADRDGTVPEGDESGDPTGQWVVSPEEVRKIVARAEAGDLQVCAHAIGDVAIEETLDTFAAAEGSRHRIEHAEVLTDALIDRLADEDVVVSGQPNFLKWAREDGLYADRLGDERRCNSNRFGALADAGATLAFGSDCMPLDPLFGVQQVVTAPTDAQRLTVTDALRAYTYGGAYAGFDEDRLGTVEAGTCADFVVLEESPWTVDPDTIADIDVAMTIVDGRVVYTGRQTD